MLWKMLVLEFYSPVAKILVAIEVSLLVCILLYILFHHIWAYVDDVDDMRIIDKFPQKIINYFGIYDGESLGMHLMAATFSVFGLIIIWPLTAICLILYGILRLLRLTNRLKKKVTKMAKIAHKHLDEVNIEKFKED